ncbi:MAG: fatty acyl-CoA reductase, partial [Pseudomonadota bacterium]
MNNRTLIQLTKKAKGRTALVTGASSGIGMTVAKMLGRAGAHVLLVSRTRETLEQVQAEIQAEGGRASVYPCDLNDMASIDAC